VLVSPLQCSALIEQFSALIQQCSALIQQFSLSLHTVLHYTLKLLVCVCVCVCVCVSIDAAGHSERGNAGSGDNQKR
jgi:hypothetical protein